MKKYAGSGRLIVFLFLATVLHGIPTESQQNFPPGPMFTVKDLSGKTWSLSDFKGKILFINFFATWCPPCRAEIPDFVELYNTYKGKGMEIIGLSLDQMSPDALRSFVQRYQMTYPVAFSTEKILNDYKPGSYIPVTIALDREGRIRHTQVGQMDRETLQNIFLILSSEK